MSLSFWGNVATLLLIAEIAVFITATGVILFLAQKGMGWLLTNLPVYLGRVRGYVQTVRSWTQKTCRQIARPFAIARGAWTGIRKAWCVMREDVMRDA